MTEGAEETETAKETEGIEAAEKTEVIEELIDSVGIGTEAVEELVTEDVAVELELI